MPEMYLRLDLRILLVDHLLKVKKLKETEYSRYICRSELDKASFNMI